MAGGIYVIDDVDGAALTRCSIGPWGYSNLGSGFYTVNFPDSDPSFTVYCDDYHPYRVGYFYSLPSGGIVQMEKRSGDPGKWG